MGLIDEFFQGLQTFFKSNTDSAYNAVVNFFNTPFWDLVGYTGIAFSACLVISLLFPAMRSFAGAVIFSLGALWYGFYKGKQSEDK